MNVTLFESNIFADDDYTKIRSLGWVLTQKDCVLLIRGNLGREADAYKGLTVWRSKNTV